MICIWVLTTQWSEWPRWGTGVVLWALPILGYPSLINSTKNKAQRLTACDDQMDFFCLDLWASSISFIPLQFFNVRKKPPYFLTDILSLMHKALMLLFTENLAFHPRSEILLVFSHFQTRTNQIFVNFLLFLLLILFKKKMQKTNRNEQKITKNGYTHWKQ